jgi:hypothetical protein
MSRAPGKYVAGTMAPAGAALDRPGLRCQYDDFVRRRCGNQHT